MDVNFDFQFCKVRMSLGFPKINYNSAIERKMLQARKWHSAVAGRFQVNTVLLSVGERKTRQEDALS